MEYTFRNSFKEDTHTVLLTEEHLIIRTSKRELGIPYSDLVDVHIDRSTAVYRVVLATEDGDQLVVSNRFFHSEIDFEDKSREYSLFVRTLHYHLRTNEHVAFTSGKMPAKIGRALSMSIIISFAISFLGNYFGIQLMDPFIEGICLAGLAVVAILAINLRQWPRHYSPTDIPLDFLP